MGLGNSVYIICRLILGAISSFLAIMLWSRTRDTAWIFVIISAIIAYVEIVYSILTLLGIAGENILPENSIFIISTLLSFLPTVFIIAAFSVMVLRKYRRR
jgi:presenilin-like A22 family membrane protease